MIERHGYVPVFIGYGILPLIGLTLVIFCLGPLVPDPQFDGKPTPLSP